MSPDPQSRMPVRQVADGALVEPDHVDVIPPNCSLGLQHHRRLLVLERQEERGFHLPVDTFLQTLADDLGPKAIGVVLFGTDIDPKAIEKARAGLFDDPLVAHLAPEQLKRFFVKATRGYAVAKRVRLCS